MADQANKTALQKLQKQAQVDKVIWPESEDVPTYVYGRLTPAAEKEPEDLVLDFLEQHGAIYGITASSEYRLSSVRRDTRGNTQIRVERVFAKRRIYPSRLSFWVDPSGVVIRIKARWPGLPKLRAKKPTISAEKAVASVANLRKKDKLRGPVNDPRLEYFVIKGRSRHRAVLVWNFIARFAGGLPSTEGFIVDAGTGKLIRRYVDEDQVGVTTTGTGINNTDETAAAPVRTIEVDDPGAGADLELLDTTRTVDIETRDMAGATDLAGAYDLCADDDSDGTFTNITNTPRSDSDRPEVGAHYSTGIMHDYLARNVMVNGISLFDRDGWKDDPTQIWTSLVHRSTDSISSFFSRTSKNTAHGDGDGIAMTYKSSLDTCSHEWGHAVQSAEITGGTNINGGFDSVAGENFVLQEASADMFAGVVNRDGGWRFAVAFEDDASLPGATHASTGSRLRGFQDPPTYDQPDHYQAGGDTLGLGFAGTAGDYTRTGILDKAAYLMAMGGTHPSAATDPATYPPIDVYGMGVRCFENIFYYALTSLTDPDDVFADFRQNMIDATVALYPADPCKVQTVERAFDAVGIYETGTTPPAPPTGPDPMITPWGANTDTPPYWQTPDIYVKDASDIIAPPMKGQINRLFALVTNIGDTDALGVDVEFSFKPYGMGTSNNAEKLIGNVVVDVAAGAAEEVEIAWDLTDLTDTNGGLWPLPLADFDHFCVKVRLSHPDDIDSCNNMAQNNFGDVGTVGSDGTSAFMLSNVEKTARWVALIADHKKPMDWTADLDLKGLLKGTNRALRELAKEPGTEIPWVGDHEDAILVPLRAGEIRPVKFKWKAGSRQKYEGPVHGCLYGQTKTAKEAGKLVAKVQGLKLNGKKFTARIVGRVLLKSGVMTVHGELNGKVDPKNGKFKAKFSGLASQRKRRARRLKFAAEGALAAAADFSFLVINGGDQQGVDLGVSIIGNMRRICSKVKAERVKRQRKYRRFT